MARLALLTQALPALLVGCVFDTSGVTPSVLDTGQRGDVTAADVALSDLDSATRTEAGPCDLCDLGRPDRPPDRDPDALPVDTQKPDTVGPVCTDWMPKPKHFEPCQVPLPIGKLDLSTAGTWTYDTAAGTLTDPQKQDTKPTSVVLNQSAGPQVRVLSLTQLSVHQGVTLRVVGDKPLVVAAWSDISVDGTIDVSSDNKGDGAGADPPDCASHAAGDGATDHSEGGGGGGGGFGGDGGDGGDGRNGSASKGAKGAKIAPPPFVRGGCKGGKGGDNGGSGGSGGGALQLTARFSITVSGTLHAGGERGGGPGTSERGGGGGGSGGYLGLDAPAVTLMGTAILAANGGGGGEGSSSNSSGNSGEHGHAQAQAAAGGSGGTSSGGNGGDGGWRDVPDGKNGSKSDDGGGGGGGGVGFVLVYASKLDNQSGTTSPNITPGP
jgi:hypothetical protein